MEQKNGFGIAALVLGIVGLITGFLGIGILLDILAIIFGIIAICSRNQKSGLGIGGLVVGTVGLFLMVIVSWILSISNTDNISADNNVSTEKSITNTSTEHQNSTFTECIIYDNNDVTATATSIDTDTNSLVSISVTIINNSDSECTLSTIYSSVNGIMADSEFYSGGCVPAGKTLNDTLELYYSDYSPASIDTLTLVFDDSRSSGETYRSDEYTLSLNSNTQIDEYLQDSSNLIYEDDNIAVHALSISDDKTSLVYSIYNKSDVPYVFWNENICADNYVIDDYPDYSGGSGYYFTSYKYIFSHRAIIGSLNVSEESITKNNISNISNIEFDIVHLKDDVDISTELDRCNISF